MTSTPPFTPPHPPALSDPLLDSYEEGSEVVLCHERFQEFTDTDALDLNLGVTTDLAKPAEIAPTIDSALPIDNTTTEIPWDGPTHPDSGYPLMQAVVEETELDGDLWGFISDLSLPYGSMEPEVAPTKLYVLIPNVFVDPEAIPLG